MVDKPGRRKKKKAPWGKIVAIVIGVLIIGAVGYLVYDTYIYSPPPVYAKVGTSLGSFYIELFPACAPKTVSNFVNLVNTVLPNGQKFYQNLVWHRIVKGFVIQTGDPNSRNAVNSTRYKWGTGGSNNTVPLEICSWLHNYAGYVGLARMGNQTAGLDTGTSQFYILTDNQTATTFQLLDGYYTIFGKVISGMNVVCTISKVPVYGEYAVQNGDTIAGQPITPVFLDNITIISQSQAPVPQPITQC